MPILSILDAVAKMEAQMLAVAEETHLAMEHAARLVETAAKAEIGHYQSGIAPFADWAPLAASTLAEKERLGYAPPDNPLLREGDLRDSIEHTVVDWGYAVVGSNSDIAVYQELGTAKMPPRSFLGAAGVQKADEVARVLWSATERTLIGPGAALSLPAE